jgi:hypothetical protein
MAEMLFFWVILYGRPLSSECFVAPGRNANGATALESRISG